ncbi:28S ribosomal protein S29, mitochondrial [Athalia rosae]|uniref:28S ribosomal protein S29, mitochondrial n=1 Tax=Athalia rosae TaxID=37344 RepID=UPI000626DC90|nr:28S ribosomal protein S29, mitochondrial [Athalia rosae]
MALNTAKVESILRRVSATSLKKYGTASEAVQLQYEQPPVHFRTIENNPMNHTAQHQGRFYNMPIETSKKLFTAGGLPKKFQTQVKTFNECSLLVRSPALEIISYLQNTDYSKPATRYVLFGPIGCGKSISLAHVVHYGFEARKIIIHVPWANNWFKRPKEVANSISKEGFLDLPIDAASWLIHFKNQNIHLLSQLDLKLGKDYQWSQREISSRGTPLLEMIELGINRIKYASEIINAIMEQLKEASTAGKCNTLVVIDGFNAFFSDYTNVKDDNKVRMPAEKISLTAAFKNITKYDWCNGSIVLSVDPLAVKDRTESHLPRYQLGNSGFEHLDPFIPISVEPYSDAEFKNVIDYYKDRKWIRDIDEDGVHELKLLSAKNPFKLMNLCAPL